MQKIVPHLWFDKEAKEAATFYTGLFADSGIVDSVVLENTPSGDAELVTFRLADRDFMAISAGPDFKFNPSISLYVSCDSEEESERLWKALIEGGSALMEYGDYPWAKKYGWLQDKYGLTWQISFGDDRPAQKITPLLMFTQKAVGKAREAIEKYVSLFPDSGIQAIAPYEKGEGDTEGYVKHARFTLAGQGFMAMESSADHKFVFNEAFSLLVNCDSQEEIDRYWDALSAVPEAEQCGWLQDEYGVSWQISPSIMRDIMTSGDKERVSRITQTFLKMKKFDIAAIREAAGE